MFQESFAPWPTKKMSWILLGLAVGWSAHGLATLRGPTARAAVHALFKPPPLSVDALKVGNIVIGQVLGAHKAGGYEVDIGTGTPATLPKCEAALLANSTEGRVPGQGWSELNAGEVYQALVIGIAGGEVNVSLARAQRAIAWDRIADLYAEDISYNATVLSIGAAGATVEVERLSAFVPWSHWHLSDEVRTQVLSFAREKRQSDSQSPESEELTCA